MIIAIVVLELIACFILAMILGVGNPGSYLFITPVEVWLACAMVQLAVHYLPRGAYVRYGLLFTVTLILLGSVTLEGMDAIPYLHQTLFIAGVAALPQIWWEWSSKATGDRVFVLALIGLVSLPLGFAAWSLANIWLVKAKAASVSRGEPYCILLSDRKLFSSGSYHKAQNDWSLTGWNMFTPRGAGGSGLCCQWDFHALLLTGDDQLFNWSYQSQRFEKVSDRARRLLGLNNLTCP
ncbi:MAG: hypothetical protein E6G88_13580 [Alphaproteobacteria bacterium]|nr:MAG: hypothetical protein E6G88_13580 [Alphaproteobacteria bacterium]